jgi:hypothetical protein
MRSATRDWSRKSTGDRRTGMRATTGSESLRARHPGVSARDRRNRLSCTEQLEGRTLMAAAPPVLQPPVPLLDPRTVPQFVNNITPDDLGLANGFFDDFKYTLVNNHVEVGAYPIAQDLGLGLLNADGTPVKTPLFGYGTSAADASYPGRSFEVQQGSPVAVTWVNGLPAQHVVNVDPTLLDPTPGTGLAYDAATNALSPTVPIVTHLHGGHSDAVQPRNAVHPDQQRPDAVPGRGEGRRGADRPDHGIRRRRTHQPGQHVRPDQDGADDGAKTELHQPAARPGGPGDQHAFSRVVRDH